MVRENPDVYGTAGLGGSLQVPIVANLPIYNTRRYGDFKNCLGIYSIDASFDYRQRRRRLVYRVELRDIITLE